MNNENLMFLQNTLEGLGFLKELISVEQLEYYTAKATKEFYLFTDTQFDDGKLEAKLYFRRSDRLEIYFFNRYDTLLRSGQHSEGERKQTFYISKGKGVAFKEAFNLLNGRSVYKEMTGNEGEKYYAWIQLNFEEKDGQDSFKMKQYRGQYRYELEKVLRKYPIQELENKQSKQSLMMALERGDRQSVTFCKPKRIQQMFIEANPATKTINIFPIRNKEVGNGSSINL